MDGSVTERAQFDWDKEVAAQIAAWCLAAGHPGGPPFIRVIDFTGQDPPLRLKMTTSQCDCGARLYLAGPVEVREVKRPTIEVHHEVKANEGPEGPG